MAGGLDNLSAEGFSQLSRTINEAKELIKQQEALLRQTLTMEQQIITRRVAGLKEYNDEYSKLLNSIASEQTSLSAEMFKINEAGKEAANNAKKAAESAKQSKAANKSSSSGGSRSTNQTIEDNTRNRLDEADSANYEDFSERFRIRRSAIISEDELSAAVAKREKERIDARKEAEKDAYDTLLNLRLAALDQSTEAAAQRAGYINALDDAKALQALKEDWDKQRAELEYQAKLEGEGKITAEAMARIDAEMVKRIGNEEDIQKRVASYKQKQIEDEQKRREKEEKDLRKSEEERHKQLKKQTTSVIAGAVSFTGLSADNSIKDRMKELRELRDTVAEEGEMSKGTASLLVAVKALSSLAQQLEGKIDEIASYKGAVDTRLYGSSNEKWAGSYWDQIVHDMTRVGAINPYFKQEDFANKIKELVDIGIAFDLEQRAFLGTISDKIATTFNVADSTLLRLIRIQQQDSTAGRLGMEAALNEFLNSMYENTEYLKTVAAGVRSSLEEMQALMDGAAATEVEYQVQKWMGSLYSVGMSQEAVNKISTALGQIAAGQIEGLTGDGAGNLLIMAANDAGLSIADILTEGLDSSNTNKLMQAVVNYLAEIAESSQDNQVVQQQLASVFGVKASDLRAATNLATKDSVGAIFGTTLSYDNMLYKLSEMAGSMWQRTSLGEMMTNVWSNLQYSLAGSMASNPLSYVIYKAATLLDNTAGGIAIPGISIMGNMVDLETTVADLMRVGAIGTGILGSIGSLVQGLSNSFSGVAMLDTLGISSGSGLAITPRGEGGATASIGGGAKTTSGSGYVGNASGSDVKNATMQEANDSKKQLMVEAQEESEANQVDMLNTTVLKIYELLDDVAHGSGYFRVKVEGYGLTKAGSGVGTMGGVSALDTLSSTSSNGSYSTSGSGGNSGSLANGGVNSAGGNSSINFGGWTTTT